jgi:putative ABC transport system substrate-binding protein
MDRRAFVSTVALGLLAAPLAAEAQPAGKVYRIGYLGNGNPTQSAPTLDAFRQGLRELGWVEGQNLSIEYRWADGDLSRLPALASDLVRTLVDVILVAGGPGIRAAQQATRTVPIVVAIMTDPVVAGRAASFARPGGSVTGLSVQFEDLATKQLELLKETVPNVALVAILDDHAVRNTDTQKAAEAAARALGLKARVFGIRDVPDLEGAFRVAKAEQANAMYVLPSPTFARHRARLAELAVKHRLPGIYEDKQYVDAGGLMSYGPSFPDMFRRSASFVDRILKGAKPGDLPIEQPTKFELVFNLKTAKALRLTIPQSILLGADQVIE